MGPVATTARVRSGLGVVAMSFALAACGSGGSPDPSATTTLAVTGTDALQFEPAALAAEPGMVEVELTAEDAVDHTLVIEQLDDLEVVAVAAGATASGTVELDAGDYTFYCSVPGHRSAGMEGVLTVAP